MFRLVFGFFFGVVGGKRFFTVFSSKTFNSIFPLLIACGTILLINPLGIERTIFYDCICGFFIGLGISGNFLLWQHTLCTRETPVDAQSLIGGTALGGSLYFLTAWLPPWLVYSIILVVFVPGTIFLLIKCNQSTERASGFPEYPKNRLNGMRKGVLSLLMPAITIGAIGFVLQIVRLLLPVAELPDALMNNVLTLSLIIGALILLLIFEKTRYRVNMDFFYLYCTPIISILLLLLPLAPLEYGFIFVVLIYGAFTIASIMAVLACNQVARHFSVPPIAICSLVFGLIYAIRLLPILLFGFQENTDLLQLGTSESVFVVAFCICLMFISYVASSVYKRYQQKNAVYSWASVLPDDNALQKTELLDYIKKRAKLTKREVEILLFLREGRSVSVIAKKLCITENTVRYHCKNVYTKLNVHSKQELIDYLDLYKHERF